MWRALQNYLRLAAAYTRLNLNAQLEYRGAFIFEVVAMILNDCVWLAFWWLFFQRFPVLRGWDVGDVFSLWAIVAAGFGLAHAIMGNVLYLPSIIAQGQLDVWMLHPRAVLPHLLLGRMHATAWGDAIFGYGVYILLVRPDPLRLAMFIGLSVSVAVLFIGFNILAASLGFYLGNSATLSEQWRFAMITFSTYPATLFDGAVKLILFTLIPAAFVSYLPVQALRELSLLYALFALAGALAVLAAGAGAFYHGLKRYESGNLLVMRD
ncbi:MAG TPA: ABC-2 family transporter protein [Terriglobia bacterium]|nr:ABC-2 family transporter protein [Terriglobia bacterium]